MSDQYRIEGTAFSYEDWALSSAEGFIFRALETNGFQIDNCNTRVIDIDKNPNSFVAFVMGPISPDVNMVVEVRYDRLEGRTITIVHFPINVVTKARNCPFEFSSEKNVDE